MTFYASSARYIKFINDSAYFYKVGYFKGPVNYGQVSIDFNYTRVVKDYFDKCMIDLFRLQKPLL